MMWHLALADQWETLKTAVLPHNQDVRGLVHIHAAIGIYLVLALFARRGLAAWWPVAVVCVLTLTNEAMDVIALPDPGQFWVFRDTGWDIVNSLLWPCAIMVAARLLERRGEENTPDE
ncbi:hypothetical protein [Novosphingobium colocasiae]|uniref:hypothetical protein n=1 Tax=Novosphingobium colocasiae TaxID=1256513 RepID=UPI0035B3AC30